jgi:hypothetical protein
MRLKLEENGMGESGKMGADPKKAFMAPWMAAGA